MQKVLRTRLIILPMLLFTKMLRTAMTLCRRYNIRKFTVDAIFFIEIQCKKMDYFNALTVFSVQISLE